MERVKEAGRTNTRAPRFSLYREHLETWCRVCGDTTPHSLLGPQRYRGRTVFVLYGCDLCHDTKAISPKLARKGGDDPIKWR